MGVANLLTLLLTHPGEFRTLCQFWLYHEQKRDITQASEFETSGYDRPSMRKCWYFLDMTSRSFSAVIKEVDGDLARVDQLAQGGALLRVQRHAAEHQIPEVLRDGLIVPSLHVRVRLDLLPVYLAQV